MEYRGYTQHISRQFNDELEAIKNDLLEMGGMVERQIGMAADGLLLRDSALAEQAIDVDRSVNAMEISIDRQCGNIIARRQPAASDLRLIISIARVTTDLERIGDEASKVAKMAIKRAQESDTSATSRYFAQITEHVTGMLRSALDAFARLDTREAIKVVLSDKTIDADYQVALGDMKDQMRHNPHCIDAALDYTWALRSLERIGDHASNIAEQVIYLTEGIDVRHKSVDELSQLLDSVRASGAHAH
ncbi:phosphate transport system regulatory protein PhoU [Luminiphilus syltensis NOR5-1B]|uniref:Phosphate-specific transport system accessory protein PhoU n=1 Tax=Luminiphilus syltensis NOR5-1B TaxID=565045 RepID=B8KRT1_9GAMM|nr:phosphate signaling complex protein PhoU [Luminiphilus syltensis]EED35509.1 phosphate transport system regulatory protein PhoU [Luminiphilus syltensis NOR5-1B]